VRRTLASATVVHNENGAGGGAGSHQHHSAALELPSWVQDNCGKEAYDSFEELRDVVADVAEMFVERLDRESKASKGESYGQLLSRADHLEHFHVYTKSSISSPEEYDDEGGLRSTGRVHLTDEKSHGHVAWEGETSTLDYHTDAGFFLSFVPAMNCQSYTTDTSSFYLKGQEEPIAFEDDEVVIMLGAGAQYWLPPHEQGYGAGGDLQEQYPFLAASHALRLSPDTHRTWYGKMHLTPSSFKAGHVDPRSSSFVKYGDVLSSFQLKDYNAHVPTSPVDGCGTSAFDETLLQTIPPDATVEKRSGRRRLQHANSPANCNNLTNFFCWHQCIEIPQSDQAEQLVQGGYSLYCLDPAKLSTSDSSIPDATTPCENGYVHNSNCLGSWQETDEKVPGYKLPYEVKEVKEEGSNSKEKENTRSNIFVPETGGKYCYGGTSMYMEGFTWQGTTCVIYLFQSWVLSTPVKFALAALGSILFGILLEFILWKRRSVYALSPGLRRLCLSALVYGVQLSMGYFIMLVIMTYSGPLFICTVGGMMLGHVSFNAQDAFVKQLAEKKSTSEAEKEEGDACCGNNGILPERRSSTELSSYQNGEVAGGELEEGKRQSKLGNGMPLTENTRLRSSVADGATPCCQYTL